MQKEDLYRWMENPDKLDVSTLEGLSGIVEEYPCFHTARLLYTKNLNLVDHQIYEQELGKTAVLCNDRRKLFYLIYRDEYGKLLNQNSDMHIHRGDRTEVLLESFLSSLGEREMADPTVDNVEMNMATTDYLSYLASFGEESNPSELSGSQKLQHQDIIDAFIEKAESDVLFSPLDPIQSDPHDTDEKDDGNEFLTETLARIYIKQKKYEQALTIIRRLSLNFPKKSVYFAHQIRFLELLILNERNKDK